jgi:hypothetical protein
MYRGVGNLPGSAQTPYDKRRHKSLVEPMQPQPLEP